MNEGEARHGRDYITYREAHERFATKEALASVISKIDQLVPRPEHELHWKMDDQFKAMVRDQFDEMNHKLEKVGERLDKSEEARLPRWFLPAIGVCAPIIAVVVAHFWR